MTDADATREQETDRRATARAEDVLEEWGERLGRLSAELGHRAGVLGARAREEAEDLWADAQAASQRLRQRAGPPAEDSDGGA